jgi:hypothetical protein
MVLYRVEDQRGGGVDDQQERRDASKYFLRRRVGLHETQFQEAKRQQEGLVSAKDAWPTKESKSSGWIFDDRIKTQRGSRSARTA